MAPSVLDRRNGGRHARLPLRAGHTLKQTGFPVKQSVRGAAGKNARLPMAWGEGLREAEGKIFTREDAP